MANARGLILVCLLAAAGGCARHGVTVERLDVALTVRPDGHLRADERLTARFGDAAVSQFHRSSPVWRHDGISEIAATMDGVPVLPGDGPGHIRVGRGPALDVDWIFPPVSAGTHQFTLAYTAANVVGISGIRGLMSWIALPSGREWDVSQANLSVDLPEAAILLQDPWVEESGWTVNRLPHGMTATRANVRSSESGTIGIEFTIDRMTPVEPQWQADQAFSDEFVPAFVAAALFILVIGAGVLVMLRIKHPPWRVAADPAAEAAETPSITPAMRLGLMRGRGLDRAVIGDLLAAGLADRERVAAARDLRVAGIIIMVFGVAVWITLALTVVQFASWPLLVPWSILGVGLAFVIAGARFGLLNETGARLRMLYFARVRDGRTSE